jgi:hypothetical protein
MDGTHNGEGFPVEKTGLLTKRLFNNSSHTAHTIPLEALKHGRYSPSIGKSKVAPRPHTVHTFHLDVDPIEVGSHIGVVNGGAARLL